MGSPGEDSDDRKDAQVSETFAWTERAEVAITACPCECCERAWYLRDDGKDATLGCICIGYLGNLNRGQCHCWFCVEAKGLNL